MRKAVVLTVIMLFSAAMVSAQTSYTDKRDVSGFTEIGFGVSGELYITIGQGYSVVLEGDQDYIRDIETKVSGSKLIIKRDKLFSSDNKKVIVRITMPLLEGFSLSGSGKAVVESPLRGDKLYIGISGSGKVYLQDVDLKMIDCSVSGSGSLLISGSGKAGALKLNISGSGNYKGESTEVGTLEAAISGSGSCDCFVTGMLKAAISGSGNIYYSGNPRIDAAISGSGHVRMK